MKKLRDISLTVITALLLYGCSGESPRPSLYPDYREVTVPKNIAPLNFHYSGKGSGRAVTTFVSRDITVRISGKKVCIPPAEWRRLVLSAEDDTIHVHSSIMGDWDIMVSRDTMDRYLTYRLIEPGYEVWNRVEIKERDVASFEERTLSSWENTSNACMNCHIHKGENSMFYLRGSRGGAILSRRGELRKLNLRRDGMISGTVYGDLHPDGRWGVFSTNIIIPGFHTGPGKRLEVFDTASDLCIADFDKNTILTEPSFCRKDFLETFPCFSADGTAVFWCGADTVSIPVEIDKLKYSLYKTPFDTLTGRLGPESELIWDASAHDASVCHPKASPDGKWLVFTVADYGTFPIWHRECDLWIMNLATGSSRRMTEICSPDFQETYHSWSSDSRWLVFASKRDDGQYGKPFICHVDNTGTGGKPFLLPQEDPYLYERTLKSFNIPDLGSAPAAFDSSRTGLLYRGPDAEIFD